MIANKPVHEFHETCHSFTFLFLEKNSVSDINRKCILPNMIGAVLKCNGMTSFMEFMCVVSRMIKIEWLKIPVCIYFKNFSPACPTNYLISPHVIDIFSMHVLGEIFLMLQLLLADKDGETLAIPLEAFLSWAMKIKPNHPT